MSKAAVKKVVLAYSGGLDTSVILKWLEDEYDCEVVTFTADIGQGEEVEPARAKAEKYGVKEIYIENLQEEYITDILLTHVHHHHDASWACRVRAARTRTRV